MRTGTGPVRVERAAHHWRVQLNRPPVNALDNAVLDRLIELLAAAEADPGCRALVIGSDLSGVFCAGADIKFLGSGAGAELDRFRSLVHECFTAIEQVPLPVVAAVEGTAVGGGLELLLACDLVVMGDAADVRLGLPEVKLGVLPGAGGTQRLTRVVGKGVASYVIMTGDLFGAQRAYELGLAAELVPAGTALARADALAASLADGPTAAYAAVKRCVRAAVLADLESGLAVERVEAVGLMATEDAREGLAAFVERRPARFVGR